MRMQAILISKSPKSESKDFLAQVGTLQWLINSRPVVEKNRGGILTIIIGIEWARPPNSPNATTSSTSWIRWRTTSQPIIYKGMWNRANMCRAFSLKIAFRTSSLLSWRLGLVSANEYSTSASRRMLGACQTSRSQLRKESSSSNLPLWAEWGFSKPWSCGMC